MPKITPKEQKHMKVQSTNGELEREKRKLMKVWEMGNRKYDDRN